MLSSVITETMNGGPQGDDDLVARLVAARRSGSDSEAEQLFALLIHRQQQPVFKLALSILGPGRRAESEDVAQEVFLKVHRRLDSFRSESQFSTWLYRITYRTAIDVTRRARFKMPHVDDQVLASFSEEVSTERPGKSSPESPYSHALRSEGRVKLYAAVMVLPDLQRAAVMMFYWMDEDVVTIAQLLNRKPGTIKSLLFRARKRLSRSLGKEGRGLLP